MRITLDSWPDGGFYSTTVEHLEDPLIVALDITDSDIPQYVDQRSKEILCSHKFNDDHRVIVFVEMHTEQDVFLTKLCDQFIDKNNYLKRF